MRGYPDQDQTEELRSGQINALGRCANTAEGQEPPISHHTKGSSPTMKPHDNAHPVDSATRTCCGGIGGHVPDCSWRKLADQLTAEQIAYLEQWEAHPQVPPRADGAPRSTEEQRTALLFTAREYVWRNSAAERFAHVAPPLGATYVEHWTGDAWESGDPAMRVFEGTKRRCGHMEVLVGGWQDSTGTVQRDITVSSTERFSDGQMSAAIARQVAAALIEAADEIEQLTSRAGESVVGSDAD